MINENDVPVFEVEEVREVLNGVSFSARKVFCPHGEWPAYTCRVCHPRSLWSRLIAWLRRHIEV